LLGKVRLIGDKAGKSLPVPPEKGHS
jgi:hypothetical protein